MDGDNIPGYDQLADIGGGGFSRVYRANDINNFRTVAIKVLNPTAVTDKQRQAFDRERKAMATIGSHPHVVQLLDSDFTAGGRPYIVMPFYENGTFADRVRDGLGLDAVEVLDLGVKIASALHTAHEHNIVHRDVKPSNVFQGDFGQHVLADFGISSFEEQETAYTKSVEVALSPSHAAPEVLDDERPNVLTDVYMLGSTLYTLLTGQLAFPGESLGAVIRKILSEPPPPITGNVPASLKTLVMEMLAKSPADRPSGALAVAEELRTIQIESGHTPTKISVRDWSPAEAPTEVTQEGVKQADAAPPQQTTSQPAAQMPLSTGAVTPTSASQESFDPDATTVRGRMAKPIEAPAEVDEVTEAEPAQTKRGLLTGVAFLVLLIFVSGLVWAGTRSGDNREFDDPAANAANPVDPDDAFPILPTTPTNVEITERSDGNGFDIVWTGAGGPDTSFEIRQVGADKAESTADTKSTLVLDSALQPCVQLRTVRASRLSEWSDQVCLEEPDAEDAE